MLEWLKGNRDVYHLVAHRNYPKAVKILEAELRKEPENIHLRQLLADVLERMGDGARAVQILAPVVDELAAEGFAAKAIAVLKKIQRIDPARADIELKLAELLERQEKGESETNVPLIQAHLEDVQPARPAEPPGAEAGTETMQLETSELIEDWLDEALEGRKDFHWSPLLEGISKEELAAVIGGLRLLVKRPGAIIYGQDEPGDSLFILATGKARVYRRDWVGPYNQVAVLREGSFFGEDSVLYGSNRLSTITAASECELLELDRETFDQICERFPRIREKLQKLADQRVSFENPRATPAGGVPAD